MVTSKIPSNLAIARYFFWIARYLFRNKSSIFALSGQSNIFRKRNPPTSEEGAKGETLLNYGK
ncbi:hypothetical protein HQ45_09710 [Porphyromonas crevioricanis]|nr:hypothetical protein HQ45_09710 [Porphyromonas crevioricanis]